MFKYYILIVITLIGVTQITDARIDINGRNFVGSIENDGSIYLSGDLVGRLLSDGSFYRGNEQMGMVDAHGKVISKSKVLGKLEFNGNLYLGNSFVGQITDDGRIIVRGCEIGNSTSTSFKERSLVVGWLIFFGKISMNN